MGPHFALRVLDVDAAGAALIERGVKVSEPFQIPGGGSISSGAIDAHVLRGRMCEGGPEVTGRRRMLSFHDPIPDVANRTCTRLLAQEYSYPGETVCSANVIFLQLDGREWHRFFIDAGVVFWERVSFPDLVPSEGDHVYTRIDLGALHQLVGVQVLSVWAIDLPGGGEVRLGFSGGKMVVVRDVDDRTVLLFETASR